MEWIFLEQKIFLFRYFVRYFDCSWELLNLAHCLWKSESELRSSQRWESVALERPHQRSLAPPHSSSYYTKLKSNWIVQYQMHTITIQWNLLRRLHWICLFHTYKNKYLIFFITKFTFSPQKSFLSQKWTFYLNKCFEICQRLKFDLLFKIFN